MKQLLSYLIILLAGSTFFSCSDDSDDGDSTNYKEERRAFIHPRCKNLIKGLEGQTYKKDTSQPDKSLGLDHFPDGYGYKVHMMFPINVSKVTELKRLGL